MRTTSYPSYLFLAALACLLLSCSYSTKKQNEYLLNRTAWALDYQPASAMTIVDSVDIRLLNEEQYNLFIALKVRARDKADINISMDTIVFSSTNFFVKKKDHNHAAFASFVSARVYESQGHNSNAIQSYQNASEWVKQTQNELLNAYIHYGLGRLLYIQQQYAESMSSLKQAYIYYEQAQSKYEYKLYSLELIALDHFYLGQKDSALVYFDRAMVLADKHQNSNYRRRVLQSMAITFCKAKELGIAKEKCRKAIALTSPTDTITMGQLSLILAAVFDGTGRVDSAAFYGYKAKELLKKSDNLVDRAYLYEVLASIEQKRGKAELSAQYVKDRQQQLNTLELLRSTMLLMQHRDKTFQAIEEERDSLKNQQIRLVIALVFFFMTTLIGLLWSWYQRTKIRLKHELTAKMELESENSKLQVELRYEVSTKSNIQEEAFAKAEVTMRGIIEESLSKLLKLLSNDVEMFSQIYKDVSKLANYVGVKNNVKSVENQTRKIKETTGWEYIYSRIQLTDPEFLEKLKSLGVELTEEEFKVSCLSYVRFDNPAIAAILKTTAQEIHNMKSVLNNKLDIKPRNFRPNFDKKYFPERLK